MRVIDINTLKNQPLFDGMEFVTFNVDKDTKIRQIVEFDNYNCISDKTIEDAICTLDDILVEFNTTNESSKYDAHLCLTEVFKTNEHYTFEIKCSLKSDRNSYVTNANIGCVFVNFDGTLSLGTFNPNIRLPEQYNNVGRMFIQYLSNNLDRF